MNIQSEITPRTRGILSNWLIEVHLKFELMQETLFLKVELLDRVLSLVSIRKNDLQTIVTVLLLASKSEDFRHLKIDDLIIILVNSTTRGQMLAMVILTKLRYRLNTPTPYVFMLRFLNAAQSDQKLEHLFFYLIELCLLKYEALQTLQFKPSLLCASAIYLALCTLHVIPAWTGLLTRHARYEEPQLRVCAELILRFQRAAGQKPAKVIYEKFLSSERSCVATIEPLDKLPH